MTLQFSCLTAEVDPDKRKSSRFRPQSLMILVSLLRAEAVRPKLGWGLTLSALKRYRLEPRPDSALGALGPSTGVRNLDPAWVVKFDPPFTDRIPYPRTPSSGSPVVPPPLPNTSSRCPRSSQFHQEERNTTKKHFFCPNHTFAIYPNGCYLECIIITFEVSISAEIWGLWAFLEPILGEETLFS